MENMVIIIILISIIIIIIIIIIIVVVVVVSFMQGVHTHIPETSHVPREYIVADGVFISSSCVGSFVLLR
jgi:hypothetical protein